MRVARQSRLVGHDTARRNTPSRVIHVSVPATPTVLASIRQYGKTKEGRWAFLPGECGLDVVALLGALRSQKQRSIP